MLVVPRVVFVEGNTNEGVAVVLVAVDDAFEVPNTNGVVEEVVKGKGGFRKILFVTALLLFLVSLVIAVTLLLVDVSTVVLRVRGAAGGPHKPSKLGAVEVEGITAGLAFGSNTKGGNADKGLTVLSSLPFPFDGVDVSLDLSVLSEEASTIFVALTLLFIVAEGWADVLAAG